MQKSYYPLPFFELAPLERFDRNLFACEGVDRDLNGFVLSLAQIYNDLKCIFWVIKLLKEGREEASGVTAYKGQLSGFDSQMYRYLIGILNELMGLISKRQDVLDNDKFQRVVFLLLPEHRENWVKIVDSSKKSKQIDPEKLTPLDDLKVFLDRIRNDSSFHYYHSGNQIKGYDYWRSGNPSDFGKDYLYASFGKNMMETRFFFADAANQGYVQLMSEKYGIGPDSIGVFAEVVNETIRNIVEKYLRELEKNFQHS